MKKTIIGATAMVLACAAINSGANAQATVTESGQRTFEVFFDFDKSDLTTAAKQVIKAAAESAKAGSLTKITVTGHTDTVGSAAYNQALSDKRASAVKGELVADGVMDGAISALGVGKAGLLVVTGDGVREPQNRRVEIAGASAFQMPGKPTIGPVEKPVAAMKPAASCKNADGTIVSPYDNYSCLDAYLGDDVFTRFARYYELEWGQSGAPTDPNALPSRREGWPATPETVPPMPFTEWPYGGTTPLGVTRTGSVDSPLMVAIANTGIGQWMNDAGIQVYGWVDAGFNVSSNTTRPGGNAPIAYIYTPNTVQLDQAVLYIDRFPDTVQTDHVDWGMRLSGIYGENYRYTTSYGFVSYQLLKKNNVYGYDFPMLYGELFIPQIGEGLMLRLGRYISLPDIEAQLGPNNYMYTHSMTYTFDNYTNEGLQSTLGVTPNLFIQVGVSAGTEATFSHDTTTLPNLYPIVTNRNSAYFGKVNPLYPGNTYKKDPGAMPSYTLCVRYTWNDGNDNFQPCANAINKGTYGYNNLQWYGTTFYHKFNDKWHIAFEIYDMHQNGVPNARNPEVTGLAGGGIFDNGGTPFSPQNIAYNAPGLAFCKTTTALKCRTESIGTTAYLNYSPDALNNFSFRPEYYDDMQGQRTGTKAAFVNFAIGWQHWLSPQIELRPEIDWDRSINAKAFNGNSNAGIPANKNYTVLGAMDALIHF